METKQIPIMGSNKDSYPVRVIRGGVAPAITTTIRKGTQNQELPYVMVIIDSKENEE